MSLGETGGGLCRWRAFRKDALQTRAARRKIRPSLLCVSRQISRNKRLFRGKETTKGQTSSPLRTPGLSVRPLHITPPLRGSRRSRAARRRLMRWGVSSCTPDVFPACDCPSCVPRNLSLFITTPPLRGSRQIEGAARGFSGGGTGLFAFTRQREGLIAGQGRESSHGLQLHQPLPPVGHPRTPKSGVQFLVSVLSSSLRRSAKADAVGGVFQHLIPLTFSLPFHPRIPRIFRPFATVFDPLQRRPPRRGCGAPFRKSFQDDVPGIPNAVT